MENKTQQRACVPFKSFAFIEFIFQIQMTHFYLYK